VEEAVVEARVQAEEKEPSAVVEIGLFDWVKLTVIGARSFQRS